MSECRYCGGTSDCNVCDECIYSEDNPRNKRIRQSGIVEGLEMAAKLADDWECDCSDYDQDGGGYSLECICTLSGISDAIKAIIHQHKQAAGEGGE